MDVDAGEFIDRKESEFLPTFQIVEVNVAVELILL